MSTRNPILIFPAAIFIGLAAVISAAVSLVVPTLIVVVILILLGVISSPF